MAEFVHGEVTIYYEVHGSGYPLVLFAPGGMRSSIEFWSRTPYNPIAELTSRYRVIAMDQRNAGKSRAPVSAEDGWQTYTSDHLALLDELGVSRCHVLGGCIGCSYCFGLMSAAPERVSAAVLQQPIGLHAENREVFFQMFDGWAGELAAKRSDISPEALASFRQNMYGGEFVFNVSRDFVRSCAVPLLVLRGNDIYHPTQTSEEIVELAPRAALIQSWKEGDDTARAVERIQLFLAEHTPA
ncbi:MAG TPA: alpha/beta hydrolase [Polyangiaceae bacterium]|nr:alpha/beta hydrolase [Polyangiaceae bacterium]